MIYEFKDLKLLNEKEKIISGVYMIFHKENISMRYIGKSNNIIKRWKEHFFNSKKSGASALSKAISENGSNDFRMIILEIVENDLLEKEIFWINYLDTLNDGLNLTLKVNDIPIDLKSSGGKKTAEKSRNGECNTFFNTQTAKKAAKISKGNRKVWKITTPQNKIIISLGLSPVAAYIKIPLKSLANWASTNGTTNYNALKGYTVCKMDISKKIILEKDKLYLIDNFEIEKLNKLLET